MKSPIKSSEEHILPAVIEGLNSATSALELCILFKRAETYMEAWRKRLVAEANAEYQKLSADNLVDSSVEFKGLAMLKAYTPRGDWVYTPEIIAKQGELARLISDAKQAKTVYIKKAAAVDPKTDSLFSISLSEKP